jgi:hypothetical protein
MHVKMTRIESGVVVPKGLFILYMNVKIVKFLAAIVTCLQINLYLEQPMEVQLFATFLQRRK